MECIDAVNTISLVKGTTLTKTLNVSLDGNPVNITGAVGTLFVKKNSKDSDSYISKSGTITDAVNGIMTFNLTATDTAIPAGDYVYSIKLVELSGRTSQSFWEMFKISYN